MYGIDISNHQRGINLAAGSYDFCLFKATEGITFKDPSFDTFAIQLTKLNKCIGCYHCARPDRQRLLSGARQEAQHFIDTVNKAGLLGKAILVLGWKEPPIDNFEWAEEWMDYAYTKTHIRPFIYADTSTLAHKMAPLVVENYPVWVAQWPIMKSFPVGTTLPGTGPVYHSFWEIWQYSASGTYPLWDGMVNLNYTEMSRNDWDSYCKPYNQNNANDEKIPTEENIKEMEEILSDDMKWAIKVGLYKGVLNTLYGEQAQKYEPKKPLTREQAASLFRRFQDYILERMELIKQDTVETGKWYDYKDNK